MEARPINPTNARKRDPLENSAPEIAEVEQTLIKKKSKLRDRTSHSQKRKEKQTINLALQKGASNWLSVLPLKYNFSVNKSVFSVNKTSLKMNYIRDMDENQQTPHIHVHVDIRSH